MGSRVRVPSEPQNPPLSQWRIFVYNPPPSSRTHFTSGFRTKTPPASRPERTKIDILRHPRATHRPPHDSTNRSSAFRCLAPLGFSGNTRRILSPSNPHRKAFASSEERNKSPLFTHKKKTRSPLAKGASDPIPIEPAPQSPRFTRRKKQKPPVHTQKKDAVATRKGSFGS